MKKGTLTVIAGPMFSGKTGKLLALIEVFTKMDLKTLVIKPKIDTRYTEDPLLHTHDNRTAKAWTISNEELGTLIPRILPEKPKKVIIDEVQFFEASVITQLTHELREMGIDIVVAGLLYDFKKEIFGATKILFDQADEKLELFAICQNCGKLANHTERLLGGSAQIEVGESNTYRAVCDVCHQINTV